MPDVIIDAYTKINLRLKVVGRRGDGYHLLSMLNERLALSDRVRIIAEGSPEKSRSDFPVSLKCPDAPQLETDSNLVVRAARRFSERYDVATPLAINILKRIPIGAGLGGGSSDAAACLMALNKLWGLYRPKEELAEVGVTIGADVPFFLYNSPAHVTGIGENVNPDVVLPKLWVLLVNPGFEVMTKDVYEAVDLGLTHQSEDVSFRPFFNDLGGLCTFIDNDLENVVSLRHPEIGMMKAYLQARGAKVAFMSGSGPTVVGLFESRAVRDAAQSGTGHEKWKFYSTENIWHRR